MENTILTWVADREYIPNTLCANVRFMNTLDWFGGSMKPLPVLALLALLAAPVFAQEGPSVPALPFESVPNPLKYSADQNLGEVLSVAVNSKGHIIVLNHPGTATAGPVYGNATPQLLELDPDGMFVGALARAAA